MEIDFSNLLTDNGIESLRNGKLGINLEIIEEVSIEKVIVSDGTSREEVVLKGEAAFPNRKIDTLKYCVINIKDTYFRNGVIIITKMEIKGQDINLEDLGVNYDRARETDPSKLKENRSFKEKSLPNKVEPKIEEYLKNQEQIFVKKEFVKETLFNEPWLIEKRNFHFQREKFHVQTLKQEEMEIEQEENNFMEIKELKENEPLNIKVAIFEKEKIIPYRRRNGETGQRLSITLQDKNGEQINATFFDESAEYYNPLIEKGKVYKMKRGRVKTVPEKFRKNLGPIQVIFEKDAQIEEVENDFYEINQTKPTVMEQNKIVNFNFLKLSEINNKLLSQEIDIAAFISEVGPTEEICPLEKKTKKVITLYDDTNSKINLILWGELEKSFANNLEDFVVFSKVHVIKFHGRIHLINSFNTTQIKNFNEISFLPRIIELNYWKNSTKENLSTTNSSQAPQQREIGFYKLKDVKETKDNVVETKYFDIIQAKVANIKYNGTQFSYPCCAVNKKCKKKVVKLNQDLWKCGKCSATFNKPNYRYVLNVKITDNTGELWVKAFDEIGEAILGKDVDTFKKELETNRNLLVETLSSACNKEYNLTLLVKPDKPYNGKQQAHVQIVKITGN